MRGTKDEGGGNMTVAEIKKKYAGYVVQVSKKGEIRLKRPSGRTVGWCMKPSDVDAEAKEWMKIYKGATLDDKRECAKGAA